MQPADLAIVVLIGLFVCALMPRAHLGLAAFAATFVVGNITHVSTKDLVGFFPSSFFILIVGVMALFAVIQVTGAMQWILSGALALVRGRVALIPMVPFVLGALLTAMGTLPAAAIAIMARSAWDWRASTGFPLSSWLSPCSTESVAASSRQSQYSA